MKSIVSMLLVVAALLVSAPAASAMAGGGRHHKVASAATPGSDHSGVTVPERSTVYAVSSGLALLAVAGWYIRRRKSG